VDNVQRCYVLCRSQSVSVKKRVRLAVQHCFLRGATSTRKVIPYFIKY
jgi:hypothetical protein